MIPTFPLTPAYQLDTLMREAFHSLRRPRTQPPRATYTTSNDTPTGLNSAVSWRLSFALISSNRRTVSWE